VLAAIAAVDTATIPPYDARLADAPLVPYPPTPGTVTATRTIGSIGVTEWTLSNGVRVLLKPMHDGDDQIHVLGIRPGGYVLADSESYASAAVAANLLGAGGVGTYSNDALRERYSGVIAKAGTSINDYSESVVGSSGITNADKTLMFQLLYLKFTAPRVDSSVFERWKVQAEHPPQVDQQRLLLSNFLRNGDPFGRPILGPIADSVDVSRALAFYHARFGDASGFTFVITGAFAPDSIRPLVERYLGGLPSTGAPAATRDPGVRPKAGPVQHYLLTRSSDPVAKTIFVFTAPMDATLGNASRIVALSGALQQRLTYVLRQQMGAIYSVQVNGRIGTTPYEHAQFQIVYTSDPRRLYEIQNALLAELDSMKTNGPTATELHDANEAGDRAREVADAQSAAWANRLLAYVASGWPLDSIASEGAIADRVTAADVRNMAATLFTPYNRIEVVAMPKRLFNEPGVRTPAAAAPAPTPTSTPAPAPAPAPVPDTEPAALSHQ
jgi:zinc protease